MRRILQLICTAAAGAALAAVVALPSGAQVEGTPCPPPPVPPIPGCTPAGGTTTTAPTSTSTTPTETSPTTTTTTTQTTTTEQPPPTTTTTEPPPPSSGPPTESGGAPPPTKPPPEPPPSQPECKFVRSEGTSTFVGLVAEQVWAGGPRYRRCALSAQAFIGVRLLRQPLRWAEIERTRNAYDFREWDVYVATLAYHGIEVLPILFEPPAWRSARPKSRARRGIYPPRSAREMASFAGLVVRRYGPKGHFWRLYPQVPKRPVRRWQVWNEPNLPYYWPDGPDAKQYLSLQTAVYRAIKRADPTAEVVSAGLPDSIVRGAVPLTRYVEELYEAGAKGSFDTLAINAYARTPSELIGKLTTIRRVMKRHRDRSKLWLTEIGWATQGPRNRFRVGRAAQANLIRDTLEALRQNRRRLGIRGVVYYNWQDADPYPGFHDFWGLHTGLLDKAGAAKPGFWELGKAAHRLKNAR